MQPDGITDIRYIRLSDLTKEIGQAIRSSFGERTFWVVAEVANHKFYGNSGWHYLTFVEKLEGNTETSRIQAKAWTEGARAIREFERATGQTFGDGIQVLANVKVEYHIVHGLSLTLLDLDTSFTLGNLERQRQATLERLLRENPDHIRKEGDAFITFNNRLRMAPVLQRIAVIASDKSAGYIDFEHTILNNPFGYKFALEHYFTTVQGADAEKELVESMVAVFQSGRSYDAVVIIRGGGSKTDFIVFDTYRISQAVARFPIPVITGIGHHQDVSIVDRMAHSPTKTPTKAAEYIIRHNRLFEESLGQLRQTVIIRAQQLLGNCNRSLNELRQDIAGSTGSVLVAERDAIENIRSQIISLSGDAMRHHRGLLASFYERIKLLPQAFIRKEEQQVASLLQMVSTASRQHIRDQRQTLQHLESLFRMMSPEHILRRGFALISQDGKVIARGSTLKKNQPVTVTMTDAVLHTHIDKIEKRDGEENEL